MNDQSNPPLLSTQDLSAPEGNKGEDPPQQWTTPPPKNNTATPLERSPSFTDKKDFTETTVLSVLHLLQPMEFFVSIDQSTLWHRHVAWAKKDGKELREYTTQRFASNMIVLSLLLSTECLIVFNSMDLITDLLTAMEKSTFSDPLYYSGVTFAFGACITIIGLVTTFLVWGQISAISDSNVNALLRSSMGQLVTALPSRLVVASLYLFLVALIIMFAYILPGFVRVLLIALVLCLFFYSLITISCFGRLIVDTGAMGNRCVLDPTFEKHLLPTGLHAALVIKAMHPKTRRQTVISQYQEDEMEDREGRAAFVDANVGQVTGSFHPSSHDGSANYQRSDSESDHKVDDRFHTIGYPGPSVLNATDSGEILEKAVKDALRNSGSEDTKSRPFASSARTNPESVKNHVQGSLKLPPPSVLNSIAHTRESFWISLANLSSFNSKSASLKTLESTVESSDPISPSMRRVMFREKSGRSKHSSARLLEDVEREQAMRELYDEEPTPTPIEIDMMEDHEDHEAFAPGEPLSRGGIRKRRMRRVFGWAVPRRLRKGNTGSTTDDEDSKDEELVAGVMGEKRYLLSGRQYQ